MLLLALDEEGCVPVGPTRWPNASLHLCRHGTHSALLAASLADASDVEMLLRVGGPHPQTIMFERTANARVWAAPFSLCMAGQYSLSTTLVLRQPWERGATPLASAGVQSLLEPTHGKPTKIALQASPGEQPLASGTFPARQSCAVHHLPSEQPLLMAEWSFEHSGAPHSTPPPRCAQCLWSWDRHTPPATRHVLDRLQMRQPHSHFHPHVPPHAVQHHLRYSLSSWRSAPPMVAAPSRRRRQPNEKDLPSRLVVDESGRVPNASLWPAGAQPICVVGDSQMRNLANALVAAHGVACNQAEQQATHGVCKTRFLTYYMEPWGQASWKMDGTQGPKSVCKTLLINFGQWPVSWSAAQKGGTWSLERYTAAVERTLEWAKGIAAKQGTAVAWVSTYPAPLNDGTGGIYQRRSSAVHADLTHCPPTDHRFPHVIARLNRVARDAARRAGVAYIDLFWNTLDVLDLAFDASHYAAPVAEHHARCVLHWMRTAAGTSDDGAGAAATTQPSLAYGCFTDYNSSSQS